MTLHRPYIRKETREEVERRAEKNEKGQFLDANTKKPIEGKYDLGHKPNHEFWREAQKAEKKGLSQEQFNEKMNNPNLYQIEDPHENRSHAHEKPRPVSHKKNPFVEGLKAEKEAANKGNIKTEKTQNIKTVDKGESTHGENGAKSGSKSGGQAGNTGHGAGGHGSGGHGGGKGGGH